MILINIKFVSKILFIKYYLFSFVFHFMRINSIKEIYTLKSRSQKEQLSVRLINIDYKYQSLLYFTQIKITIHLFYSDDNFW